MVAFHLMGVTSGQHNRFVEVLQMGTIGRNLVGVRLDPVVLALIHLPREEVYAIRQQTYTRQTALSAPLLRPYNAR